MTYTVIVEPTAAAEIRHAVRWMAANRSNRVAVRWLNTVRNKVLSLKTLPHRCPLAAENDKFPEEIRELLFGRTRYRYRIIFTIRGNAVHVLDIRHGAQDEIEP